MQGSARYGFLCGCQACSVEDLKDQEEQEDLMKQEDQKGLKDLEGLEVQKDLKGLGQLWEEHVASQDTVWRREGSILLPAAWAEKGSSSTSHPTHG